MCLPQALQHHQLYSLFTIFLATLWVWTWPPCLDILVYVEIWTTVTFSLYLVLVNLKDFSFRAGCEQPQELDHSPVALYLLLCTPGWREPLVKLLYTITVWLIRFEFWILCFLLDGPSTQIFQSALCKQSGFSLNYLEYSNMPTGKLCSFIGSTYKPKSFPYDFYRGKTWTQGFITKWMYFYLI